MTSQLREEVVVKKGHGITFTHELCDTTHRRGTELDNGWRIVMNRGLDIFQKPDSKYELSEVDQARKSAGKQRSCIYDQKTKIRYCLENDDDKLSQTRGLE